MSQKTAKVEKMNMRGMGIVHCDGRRIPVPGSIDGETIRFELVPLERNRTVGRILEVLNPSIKRTNPDCTNFPGCPGCHIRHLQYDAQRDYAFQRIAFVSAREPLIPTDIEKMHYYSIPCHSHYRIRCTLSPALAGNRVIMGMKSIFPDQPFVDLSACPNHHPKLNQLIEQVVNFFNQTDGIKKSIHLFRNIQFYLGANGQNRVVFVVVGDEKHFVALKEYIRAGLSSETFAVLFLAIKTWKTGVEFKMPEILCKDPWLHIHTQSGKFEVLPSVWTPIGLDSVDVLMDAMESDLSEYDSKSVVELGCGGGLMTLPVAQRALTMIGIDKNRFAIESAQRNLGNFNSVRVFFRVGDAAHALRKVIRYEINMDTFIVHGMRKPYGALLLDVINATRAKTMIIMSPSLGSWFRDAHHAILRGWRLTRFAVCDQIPHTSGFLIYGCLRKGPHSG